VEAVVEVIQADLEKKLGRMLLNTSSEG
jgi:hypothetical protein